MYKTILKIFLFIFLLFFSFSVFASEAILSLDKKEIDINDYINLSLQISITSSKSVEVSEIKGLDNFDIIGQSQSQSSSTKVAIINGKSKTQVETILNLQLTLQAKNKGEFTLGPAILKNNNEEIKSNIVKIKITGDKLFINNNHLKIKTSTNKNNNLGTNKNNNIGSNNLKKKEVSIDTYDDIEKKVFKDNKELYLLIGVILFVLLLGYIFVVYKHKIIKENKVRKEDNLTQSQKEEVDFEETRKDIVLPELTDKDFINKISDIFKQKLYNKYKINDIYNKTFNEIKKEIKPGDKDVLLLIDLINKSKYSNIIFDNNKILSLIKKL